MDLLKGEPVKKFLTGVFSETTFTMICIGVVLFVFDKFSTKSDFETFSKGTDKSVAELKVYADAQDAAILKEVSKVQVQVVDVQTKMVAEFQGFRKDQDRNNTETQKVLRDIYYKLPRGPASQAKISLDE